MTHREARPVEYQAQWDFDYSSRDIDEDTHGPQGWTDCGGPHATYEAALARMLREMRNDLAEDDMPPLKEAVLLARAATLVLNETITVDDGRSRNPLRYRVTSFDTFA